MSSEEVVRNESDLRTEKEAEVDLPAQEPSTELRDIFTHLKGDSSETALPLDTILQVLASQGLSVSVDPRLLALRRLVQENQKIAEEKSGPKICLPDFERIIEENGNRDLLTRALTKNLVIPNFAQFSATLEVLYEINKRCEEGEVAGYIPELCKQKADWWAVSVCTVDGQMFNMGDCDVPFTLQSTVKPFMYSLCLELLGKKLVHEYVGQEPSNQDFNAITLDKRGRPYNPMVNAGAIMVCSLIQTLSMAHASQSEKFNHALNYLKMMSGGCGTVQFNNAVFISERETASRNRAIAYFMKAKGCFPKNCDVLKSLDFYFQSCSMEVTSCSLAVMAATLANGGVCPLDNKRAVSPENARCVLSLMQSSGMYNLSGEFAYSIGIPSKAGVSGSVCLVVPGLLGVAMFSPRINDFSCSTRAYRFTQDLMKIFTFHPFEDVSIYRKDAATKILENDGLDSCCGLRCAMMNDVATPDKSGGGRVQTLHYRPVREDRSSRGLSVRRIRLRTLHHQRLSSNHQKKDCMGRTALDDARHFGHNEIANYLESWLTVYDKTPEPTVKQKHRK